MERSLSTKEKLFFYAPKLVGVTAKENQTIKTTKNITWKYW